MKAQIIKPDSPIQESKYFSLFLAGSIENGEAEEWQQKVEKHFSDFKITIYNPRRPSWDKTIEQKETNPIFSNQVNWELNAIDSSNFVFMYFSPGTKSPITLLELGIIATTNTNLIVCCPEDFWRRGNVEIVCSRYGIPIFSEWDKAIASLTSRIRAQF